MVLFIGSCALCGLGQTSPCYRCAARFVPPPPLPPPAHVDRFVALFGYQGEARRLVTQLKFANRRDSVTWLADQLAGRLEGVSYDCVTWLPSSHRGRRERGYDAGKLLARKVARRLGLPAYRLLIRSGDERQTVRALSERRGGPRLDVTKRAHQFERVLLIDDVCTTGASISVAAQRLRASGVVYVAAAVVARTPVTQTTVAPQRHAS